MPTNFDEHGRYRPSVMDDPSTLLERIANHEATIDRLRLENAQLRANVVEYRVECEKLRQRVPVRSED